MQHKDISPDIDQDIPVAATRRPERIRGPINGGWVVMLLAGLLAGLANLAVLRGDGPTARVAILAEDAAPGTPADALPLRFVPVEAGDDAFDSVVTETVMDALATQVAVQHLPAGTMLRVADLGAPGPAVPHAMSLPIDPARAVAGDLAPGDVIDVIADDVDGITDYVVRGATVVATSGGAGGLGVASVATSVTVAVGEGDAIALARAMRAGDLDLVRVATGTRAADS